MYDLQSKDPETWNLFLDRNLSVSENVMSFCSISVDHAIEQEVKSMKIQGEIKRIGNNESTLWEQFLISCKMCQITEAFLEFLPLNSGKIERPIINWLKELTIDITNNITNNVRKLKEVMKAWCNLWKKKQIPFSTLF